MLAPGEMTALDVIEALIVAFHSIFKVACMELYITGWWLFCMTRSLMLFLDIGGTVGFI